MRTSRAPSWVCGAATLMTRPPRSTQGWECGPRSARAAAWWAYGAPLDSAASRARSTVRAAPSPRWPSAAPTPKDPMPALERTLILLKPDCVQRGLIGRIVSRFEEKGLRIVGLQMRRYPRELLEQHYAVHRERPFFPKLVAYMGSGPVVALALEGLDAIEVTRGLIGATNSRKAAP